ncbi:CpaF family protein [Frankia sp. AgB1.9]|uniref:CpaF family protein n=1 Tax=unclassified Frankia TaxID=2632575 RepID=UPI001931AD8F|nr:MULTISPECIES: ATPase, T2SS/T4P/T4SS family [unclassified Frankia]MBL7487771.1 CpaF family protein [Frankia sp. AgW1.1]MBL7553719.1 CpaF family protein [Frankia sp. AgB1.9]MBL7622931.1 CpaF family protein [Frankia sp. AgB1.8]
MTSVSAWARGPGELTATALPGRASGSAAEGLRIHLREGLRAALAARLSATDTPDGPGLGGPGREAFARSVLVDLAEAHTTAQLARGVALLSSDDEQQILAEVLAEVLGLGGLEPLLADSSIENINITGDRVFIRRADGSRHQLPPITGSDSELIGLIRDLAAHAGIEERRWDRGAPLVNFHLPDKSRVFAAMAVTARPSVSIRRHRFRHVTLGALRANGTIDYGLEMLLACLVHARKNVIIAGGTAMGKTTLLLALADQIPPSERLVTVEDVFELGLDTDAEAHPDVVAMQVREANTEGEGQISASDLVRAALRMSPDRVIVGEVRGAEVIPMLNAMSQGNDGSMTTVHSSTSRGVFTRLASYAVQGPERLPLEATNLMIASAIHVVVHLAEPRGERGRRVVSSVREVVDADGPTVITNELYRPGSDRRGYPAAPPTGELLDDLIDVGFDPQLLAQGRWS